MRFNLNAVITCTAVVFIIAILYSSISVLGSLKIDKYQPDRGNETLFLVSGVVVVAAFCLMVALLFLKLLRKVRK